MADRIEALVDGGRASAGPPLGPALGPAGVNIGQVIAKINERTKDFAGMKVPIAVIIDPKTKSFEIEVGTPPASALIKDALKIESGSGNPRTNKVGNLTIDQAIKVARMKADSLLGKTMKDRVKEIVGTCVSMGVNFEGKDAKKGYERINNGEFDAKLKE